MEKSTVSLIDSVIASWSDWDNNEEFYLGTLVTELVKDPKSGTTKECEVFEKLIAQLNDKDLNNLADLIKARREEKVKEAEQKMEQRRLEQVQKDEEKVVVKAQYDVESEKYNQERLEVEKRLSEERRLRQLAAEEAEEAEEAEDLVEQDDSSEELED